MQNVTCHYRVLADLKALHMVTYVDNYKG